MNLKPYELVWVIYGGQNTESGKYMAVGQLMSYPTPEGTIMVRRVPGHPGTLEEMPVQALMAISGPKPKYINYAIVKAVMIRGDSFPTDMLRYDNCAPVNFKLVRKGKPGWEREMVEVVPPAQDGEPLLVSKTSTRQRNVHWTVDRWRSFGWDLKEFRTEIIEN